MRDHLPLGSFSPALTGACSPTQPAPVRVTLDSPAVDVMTDFAHVPAATIEPASIAAANDCMIARGVRSLLVVSPEGRTYRAVGRTDRTKVRGSVALHAVHSCRGNQRKQGSER